jgi:hypothetical protein
MNEEKRRALEADGWVFEDAEDFLGLPRPFGANTFMSTGSPEPAKPAPTPAAPLGVKEVVVIVFLVVVGLLGTQFLARHLRLEWVTPTPVAPVNPTPAPTPTPTPKPFPSTWVDGGFKTYA